MEKSCGFCCTKINHISVKRGSKQILKDVSIHIHCGKLTAIIGKNGAGKSTLLRAILGEIPHEGEIVFESKTKGSQKIKIGYVPQKLALDDAPITVYDMVAAYSSRVPVFLRKSKKVATQIQQQLALFGAEDLLNRKVNRLSGGEFQRVMLAMAMMSEPDLLILDEPISGIDKNGKEQFYSKIDELKKTKDVAIIIVSHDFEYVKKYADNVILLHQVIEEEGTPEQVFQSEKFIETFGKV